MIQRLPARGSHGVASRNASGPGRHHKILATTLSGSSGGAAGASADAMLLSASVSRAREARACGCVTRPGGQAERAPGGRPFRHGARRRGSAGGGPAQPARSRHSEGPLGWAGAGPGAQRSAVRRGPRAGSSTAAPRPGCSTVQY